MGLITS